MEIHLSLLPPPPTPPKKYLYVRVTLSSLIKSEFWCEPEQWAQPRGQHDVTPRPLKPFPELCQKRSAPGSRSCHCWLGAGGSAARIPQRPLPPSWEASGATCALSRRRCQWPTHTRQPQAESGLRWGHHGAFAVGRGHLLRAPRGDWSPVLFLPLQFNFPRSHQGAGRNFLALFFFNI